MVGLSRQLAAQSRLTKCQPRRDTGRGRFFSFSTARWLGNVELCYLALWSHARTDGLDSIRSKVGTVQNAGDCDQVPNVDAYRKGGWCSRVHQKVGMRFGPQCYCLLLLLLSLSNCLSPPPSGFTLISSWYPLDIETGPRTRRPPGVRPRGWLLSKIPGCPLRCWIPQTPCWSAIWHRRIPMPMGHGSALWDPPTLLHSLARARGVGSEYVCVLCSRNTALPFVRCVPSPEQSGSQVPCVKWGPPFVHGLETGSRSSPTRCGHVGEAGRRTRRTHPTNQSTQPPTPTVLCSKASKGHTHDRRAAVHAIADSRPTLRFELRGQRGRGRLSRRRRREGLAFAT